MPQASSSRSAHVTLALATLVHAFTHAYQTVLVPVYLLMRDDLRVRGVQSVALIVTLYIVVYSLLSYPAGILADRFNRKILLAIGLIGNAAAITLMGFTRQYELLLLLGAVAGLFGTLFHPTANALIPAHYPRHMGTAIGILGAGSGLGFFVGPQYTGWRATHLSSEGSAWAWQAPLVELGIVGILFGIIVLIFAREVPHAATTRVKLPLGRRLRRQVILLGPVLGLRDFAGVATSSLVSIYLQKAWSYNPKQAGFVVGAMMLISTIANPLAVALFPGKRRLPSLSATIVVGGLLLAVVPHVPIGWLLVHLAIFQVFHLGSYAIGEAAIVERVSPDLRGRVIGLYITIVGTMAATSPWVAGLWTDLLGARASTISGYYTPFAVLGGLMVMASFSSPIIARMGHAAEPQPATALLPAVNPAGWAE
jgi:DHA1 family multidrug resistance protein-like MFS transporter